MTTNTLQMPSRTAAPAISTALRELFSAASQLASAVRATLFQSVTTRALSVADEAEQVRMLAETYCQTDPGFAQDLFAAADRHEILNGAK